MAQHMEPQSASWLSSLTNMVGSMFVSEEGGVRTQQIRYGTQYSLIWYQSIKFCLCLTIFQREKIIFFIEKQPLSIYIIRHNQKAIYNSSGFVRGSQIKISMRWMFYFDSKRLLTSVGHALLICNTSQVGHPHDYPHVPLWEKGANVMTLGTATPAAGEIGLYLDYKG